MAKLSRDRHIRADASLSDIRTFLVVAEMGTLTAAAKRLGISQPAVTRQMQKLEEATGAILFRRDGNRSRLTRAGESLLGYARRTIGDFDRMQRTLRDGAQLTGILKIAASSTPGDFLLPDWIVDFSLLHPGVVAQVDISDSLIATESVLQGQHEVGVVGLKPTQPELESFPVSQDEVVLAVPIGHRFARRRLVRLKDLEGEPFIRRVAGSGMTVESMVASQGLELPSREIVMTLSSARAVLHAVERGIGLGWCTIRAFESGQILGAVPVRIAEIRFNRQLHVIHRRGQLGDIPRAFLQWLRDERSEVIDEEVEQTARVISDGGPAGFKPGTATQPSP